jgi:UDP-2,4-diacetamido-2,4,6-trideoxy-beta-L-altropyranose hydrolase
MSVDVQYNLRRAKESDTKILFEWANDEEVRANSINSKKFTFQDHEAWFKKRINSADSVMYILEVGNDPAAQIRFDYNDSEKVWEISYSVSRNFRGKGIGKLLITEALNSFRHYPIVGYVKETNQRSQNIFNALGFKNVGMHQVKNVQLIKFIKNSVI